MQTWRKKSVEEWVGSLADGEPQFEAGAAPTEGVRALAQLIEAEASAQALRRARARRWKLVGVAGVVLGSAAAVGLWARRPTTDSPRGLAELRSIERDVTVLRGSPSAAAAGQRLGAGDTLTTTGEGRASLGVANGGRLELGSFSELRLVGSSDGRRLSGTRLGRGSVDVDLPKQPVGEQFVVTTPDATVTVVGTKFHVAVAESESGPVTCVSVSHGLVHVEASARQALLRAGEQWASRGALASCEPKSDRRSPAPPTELSAPASELEQAPTPKASHRGAPPPAVTSEPRAGTLAEENRLFLELVQARRDGKSSEARALQQRFLQRYPQSALAPQVREERLKTP